MAKKQSQFMDCFLPELEETGRVLGRGAYGEVVELLLHGTKVAGKKIHNIFFDSTNDPDYVKSMKERFQQECVRMSQLRHPNLVQFLGVHYKLGSDIPILVMECLPMSLTQYLEQYKMIPNHNKNSILLDVSLGLLYLHKQTPPIVHRDLTANNVLLTSAMKAKIADLGVSCIFEPEPTKHYMRMSTCPGTQVYMPPEAQKVNFKETSDNFDKLDVFSFGVLILHVYTQEWPEPTDPFDEHNIPKTEVQRRKHILDKIESSITLKQLIEQCLNNQPWSRPRSIDLVRKMEHFVDESNESHVQKGQLEVQLPLDRTYSRTKNDTVEKVEPTTTIQSTSDYFKLVSSQPKPQEIKKGDDINDILVSELEEQEWVIIDTSQKPTAKACDRISDLTVGQCHCCRRNVSRDELHRQYAQHLFCSYCLCRSCKEPLSMLKKDNTILKGLPGRYHRACINVCASCGIHC